MRADKAATERAEARARENGYEGAWPPRWPDVKDADDVRDLLSRLDAGEAGAFIIRRLRDALPEFLDQIEPDDLATFTRGLIQTVANERNAVRVRLRAAEAALTNILEALDILEADEADDHACRCLGGMAAAATPENIAAFAAALKDIAARRDARNGRHAIRAGQLLKRLVHEFGDRLAYRGYERIFDERRDKYIVRHKARARRR